MFQKLRQTLLKRKRRKDSQYFHMARDSRDIRYEDIWKLCREILPTIDLVALAKRPATTKHLYHVRTPYPSLDLLIADLQNIYGALHQEQRLVGNWNTPTQTLTVAEFMKTHTGHYMNFADMALMVKYGMDICQLMEQAEGQQTGEVGFNNRALIPFFMRFRDILIDLHDLQWMAAD